MSDAHPRFAEFIWQCLATLELPQQGILENRFMFHVGERWVEVKYDPKDDRATLASLVFMRAPDVKLRADLLASFNAYNLFNGGYCLVAIEDAIVYLCQPHRLESIAPRNIRGLLETFATRAIAAGAWYIMKSEECGDAPPRSSSGEMAERNQTIWL